MEDNEFKQAKLRALQAKANGGKPKAPRKPRPNGMNPPKADQPMPTGIKQGNPSPRGAKFQGRPAKVVPKPSSQEEDLVSKRKMSTY